MQLDANFSKLRRLHSYKLRVKTVGRYLHGQFPETRSTGEVVGLAGREGEGGSEGGGGIQSTGEWETPGDSEGEGGEEADGEGIVVSQLRGESSVS